MHTRALAVALFLGFCPLSSAAQTPTLSSILVKAGKLLDVRKGAYVENAGIWIEGERIKEVGPFPEIQAHVPSNTKVIELGRTTVVPGLIDCHTHLMARIPEGPDGYTLNLATKSQAFRAFEGAYNARITLEAATNSSALMNWQDRVGAVEPGKYADLIAVEGDPLSDITVLEQVKFVMKGGAVVKDMLAH